MSIRYTKNIMQAYENVNSNAIVINTSYSDAVIPWLKTAGKAYQILVLEILIILYIGSKWQNRTNA